MKKKIISEQVTDVSPYELETSLGNLHAQIGQWIAKYGHNAKLEWDAYFQYDYDPSPSPRFNIKMEREETDDELARRVKADKEQKEEIKKRELAEFNRLKKKFGEK